MVLITERKSIESVHLQKTFTSCYFLPFPASIVWICRPTEASSSCERNCFSPSRRRRDSVRSEAANERAAVNSTDYSFVSALNLCLFNHRGLKRGKKKSLLNPFTSGGRGRGEVRWTESWDDSRGQTRKNHRGKNVREWVHVCLVAHVNAIVYVHVDGVCWSGWANTPANPLPSPTPRLEPHQNQNHNSTATRRCSITYLTERNTRFLTF